jgi:cytochrome P460
MKVSTSLIVCGLLSLSAIGIAASKKPHAAAAGPQLPFPNDYRQWVYLSSGLNMLYAGESDLPCKEGACPPMFENVFVRPEAYKEFVKNKIWPVGTVFILERRCSVQKESIDTTGSTQRKLFLIAASQKTAANGWNYYIFNSEPLTCLGNDPTFAGQHPDPSSNSTTDPTMCWQCHHDKGLKDNTFIQFYPTLKPLVATTGK